MMPIRSWCGVPDAVAPRATRCSFAAAALSPTGRAACPRTRVGSAGGRADCAPAVEPTATALAAVMSNSRRETFIGVLVCPVRLAKYSVRSQVAEPSFGVRFGERNRKPLVGTPWFSAVPPGLAIANHRRMNRIRTAVLVVLLLPATVTAQSVTDGVLAIVTGDHDAAVRILSPYADEAKDPDPLAAFFLATLFHSGRVRGDDNYLRACGLYQTAARTTGSPVAR